MARASGIGNLRNIGIMAHIDAGKTTVTERILFYSGKSHRMGEVDDGSTVMDWMALEQERGITITSAATSLTWKECTLNLIDTPGHVDFTIEVERSLRVLDGAVAVLCGVAGVESQTETVWRQATAHGVPTICFVNKMDRVGADFGMVLEMIRQRLHVQPLALQLPIGREREFSGVVDLVEQRVLLWDGEGLGEHVVEQNIPSGLAATSEIARTALLESLAELDDAFMAEYLESGQPAPDRIRAVIRRLTLARRGFPVLCGAALRNRGIQPLLDAIRWYLPSPLDRPAVVGRHPVSGAELTRRCDAAEPFTALIFKVAQDADRRHCYLRVYAGTAKPGDEVYNPALKTTERLARLFRMNANKRERLDGVGPGDIVAAAGLKLSTTGHTLCTQDGPIVLESIRAPEPVISLAVEPRSVQDADRLRHGLAKLADEDPTFVVRDDPETGQMVISGMGELHLEIILDRLTRDFNVQANHGRPQVILREAIGREAEGRGHFRREIGGRLHEAGVRLRLAPVPRGQGVEYVSPGTGATLSPLLLEAVEQGIGEALSYGVLAGHPLIGVRAEVLEVIAEEASSSPMACKAAAYQAAKEANRQAEPLVMEPVMLVEVTAPEEFVGDVIRDLGMRGGMVEGVLTRVDARIIRASVPLGALFGYSTALRSSSQGRATFTMQFDRFQPQKRTSPGDR